MSSNMMPPMERDYWQMRSLIRDLVRDHTVEVVTRCNGHVFFCPFCGCTDEWHGHEKECIYRRAKEIIEQQDFEDEVINE